MKKWISLILALALCVGLALPALAAESDFTIENGVLTNYNGPGGDVTIPDGVTAIGWGAFRECTSLTSLVVPGSVTSISQWTFSDCTGLTSVIIPNSVTSIGQRAFSDCDSLTTVYYGGTREQWEAVDIGKNNTPLLNANVVYNSAGTFSDVPADAWYADSVAWAVEKGVTNGAGDGTAFSPDMTCTRAQIVTFLHRALGE